MVGFVLLNYIQPLVNLNTQKANLQTEISSKESEKGQLDDWIQRLVLDSTNIALQQLAKSLDTEKEQLASLNESLKQQTENLEKRNKAAQANLASIEKRIAVLNAQEEELQVKIIITEAFGALNSARYAIALKYFKMIKANNYYDKRLNPAGRGIDHQFQSRGDSIIFDTVTGLTWQQRLRSSRSLRTILVI